MKFFIYITCFLSLISIILNSKDNKKLHKLEESENVKYLEYSFKRNLTLDKNMKPIDFFKTYFYNQLYINIKVGSNKKEIPFYFFLQQFPLVLQSSNVDKYEVKGKYDELKSNKYEAIGKMETFENGDLTEGILSKDIFHFNSGKSYIKFYLSKKNYGDAHITEGGKIGFMPYPQYLENETSSFITNLKENNLISYKTIFFKYDSEKLNEDSGKLYIGAPPHLFKKNQYSSEYYLKGYTEQGYEGFGWIYLIDEIKIGDNEPYERAKKAYFYSELGFIIGSDNFFQALNKSKIWIEYFNITKKCHKQNFNIEGFESNDINYRFYYAFTGYYCDKDVNITELDIGEISFVKKQIDYIFNISIKDLWIEKDNYKYFMILQSPSDENIWFFGKPFFKKYQMVFDSDNKVIGFYTNITSIKDKSKNKHVLVYILVIIGLVIIIIGLVLLLIKCYNLLPRLKRANELTENFDYSPDENNDIN